MDMVDFFGESVSIYTRQQVIEDGVLVDVSELAKETGFKIPVAFTAAVWAACERERYSDDSMQGRARDVLWMAFLRVHAALKNRGVGIDAEETAPLPFSVAIWRTTYRLWIVFNAAEGFTIGLPEDF